MPLGSLFGGSGTDTRSRGDVNKLTNSQQTNLTDASATAAEGAISSSGSGNVTVNSVDDRVTGQAFNFGGQALQSNTLVAGAALDTGLESLRIAANFVPDVLKQQSGQTDAILKAAQQQVGLAEQFASQGASLARSGATGGASALLQDFKPIILGTLGIVAAVIVFRGFKKGKAS